MEKVIRIPAELKAEAMHVLNSLTPHKESATLITLSGELGAGKTAFTKEVAKALGVEEPITSPTFVLQKIYLLPQKGGHRTPNFLRLIHIDAYRLEKGTDLTHLDIDELVQDPHNLILLEWPEKVADALPVPSARLTFRVNADGSRTISYA